MFKKNIAVISAVLAVFSIGGYLTVPLQASTDIVNKVVYIKRFILGKSSTVDKTYSDIDKNGEVNVYDIIKYKHEKMPNQQTNDLLNKLKVGDTVSYKGIVYATSYGTGNSVEISGLFTVSGIITDKTRECRLQLKGNGWVPVKNMSDVKFISEAETTTTTVPSVSETNDVSSSVSTVQTTKVPETTTTPSGSSTSENNTTTIVTQPVRPPSDTTSISIVTTAVTSETTNITTSEIISSDKIENAVVYRIKNAGSGKYLNVDAGRDENSANIYQWDADNSREQAFKTEYIENSDTYILRAICSSNGTDKVVNISGSAVINGCNVDLYSPLNTIAQQWKFVSIGNDKYKILSYADTSLALTSKDNANGSDNRNTSSSSGNVYIADDDNSNYQIWYFEKD